MSPTARSLKHLRDTGWPLVQVVERWNAYAHVRQDLFGFIDVIAVRGNTVLAVQTTSGSHLANRLAKIKATPAAAIWLESPNRWLVIHGWSKCGPRGKRKVWTLRELTVTHEMLVTNSVEHVRD